MFLDLVYTLDCSRGSIGTFTYDTLALIGDVSEVGDCIGCSSAAFVSFTSSTGSFALLFAILTCSSSAYELSIVISIFEESLISSANGLGLAPLVVTNP